MEDFIPTRATLFNKGTKKLYEATEFKAHKKKKVDPAKNQEKKENFFKKRKRFGDNEEDELSDEMNSEPVDQRRKDELEMKRLRYDVIKFGTAGMEKKDSYQAKIALAISLGAEPPKNKKMNYKKLIEKRKLEKLQENKKKKHVTGFDSSKLRKNMIKVQKDKIDSIKKKHSKKNNKSGGILEHYGKVNPKMDKKKKGFKKGKSFKK